MVGTRRSSRATRNNPLPTPNEKKALSGPSEASTPSSGNQVPTPLSLSDEEDVKPLTRGKRRASSSVSTRSSKRQVLDHVSVPTSTRSSSRRSVKAEPEDADDVLLLTDNEDDKNDGVTSQAPTRGRGRGRASNVKLEPESDEEDRPLAQTTKGGRKGKAKAVVISSDDDDEDDNDGDFVLSEEDVKPGPRTPSRAAILRAAERRLAPSSKSELPTPGASGTSTPLADRVWAGSASEAEESDFVSDLSEEDTPPPKKKGKGKGKGKVKGQRLDGGESEELPAAWGKKKKSRRERDADDEEKKEIKKQENARVKELGRKLTQGEKNQIRLQRHHPELVDAWGDLEAGLQPVKPVPMEAHPSLKLTLLPFQKESLYWMKKQEEGPWKGGMLADEMGMGKTIQTIALLLSEPRRKPSLVVAPVVALMQWKNEIETHAEGFSVCLWHGNARSKIDLKMYDVVLCSYGTLEASFRRQQRGFKRGNLMITEPSPMHAFEWFRVILDEAHNIKERTTNAAKAAFALKAQYRWCLSGTPLQNRVGELYSLVRFLGADPFSYYFCKKCPCKALHWRFSDRRHCDGCGHKPMDHVSFWNSEILTPIVRYGIEQGNPGQTAFKKLKILLDRMMLRRTKLERADDLGLPPRTMVIRRDFFSPAERELYMSLFTNAKREFNTYVEAGTVLNNYSNIFSLITRMRQMACHPDLVLKSKTSSLAQPTTEGSICRICNDAAEDAIVSQCHHVFDRECIRQYLEMQQLRGHNPECPVCHIEISIDLEQEAIDLTEANQKRARQGILSRLDVDKWRSSSKLEALIDELEKLRKQDCTIKSLVFSQFVSFLDIIAFRLQRAGFNICRLEGGMTPQQRDATIQHFMKNTQVTVFLISLKAGGVALNLTEASRVFMMDSWWNPSVENQAGDRIHRLGQKRAVTITKFVVEDSIEDQIVKLQAKKLAMTDAALSKDPDAALGKLTVEDLGFLFKM